VRPPRSPRSSRPRQQEEKSEFEERVIRIDRTRKTVKGGRISSSRVVVVVGDGKGHVGIGVGKARNAPEAIAKAVARAKKTLIRVPMENFSIAHQVQAQVGGAVILLRPASRGTGIIAGGATRQIIEVSGIRDVLTKSLGSGNVFNRAMACFKALTLIRDPRKVAEARGTTVEEMLGRSVEDPYRVPGEEEETMLRPAHVDEDEPRRRGRGRGDGEDDDE